MARIDPRAPTMRKTSLVFVITSLHDGGAQHHLAMIIPRLIELGFEIGIISLRRDGLISALAEHSHRIHFPPLSETTARWPRPFSALQLPVTVAFVIFSLLFRKPDIVHAFLPAACIVAIPFAYLVGIKVRIGSRRSLDNYQRGRRWVRLMERLWFTTANAVLANSNAVLDQLLLAGAKESKTAVIYNGIDGKGFRRTDSSGPEARHALGVPRDALVFVVVANLIDYKGHADLLRALDLCRSLLPDWRLICIGRDDGYGAELCELAQRLDLSQRVQWLGARDDVPGLLPAADVMVLPSHQEGFPNSVLEGMAAGLAIVASKVGGVPEAIVDGESGLLVNPRDPTSLAAALTRLAADTDLRHRLARNAADRQQRRFGVVACTDRYASLYRGLLEGRSARVVTDQS